MRNTGRINTMQRTVEQQRAIEHSKGQLTLVAGAGAGKTGVLTERFVHLVSVHHVPPEAILTVTFTRKATAEMKTRIIRELDLKGMHTVRRQVENAYIHTVHALCRRLLQENPFEAQVDPDLQTLDTRAAYRLKQSAFTHALATLLTYSPPERLSHLRELIARYLNLGGQTAQGDPLHMLRTMVNSLLERTRHAGIGLTELSEWAQEPRLMACQRLATLLKAEPHLPIGELLHHGPTIEDLLFQLQDCHSRTENPLTKQACIDWISLLKNWNEEQEEYMEALRHALLELTAAYAGTYEALKLSQGALDFQDLQLRTLEMLKNSSTVRHRYQQLFRYVMVDEFQDIDPLQAKIIHLLAGAGNVMVVGDLQQAIYGFRYADVRVFQNWIEHSKAHQETLIEMHHNFRSRPEILSFVAHVFENAWKSDFRPPLPARHISSQATGSQDEPAVQVWYSSARKIPEEAHLIASTIREWVAEGLLRVHDVETGSLRPAHYGDFALLFHQFTAVNTYEMAFRNAGVPAFVVGGGRGYWLRYEVRDLVNLLKAMIEDEDELAWVSLLHSPLVGLSLDAIALLTMQAREQNRFFSQCIQSPADEHWEADRERINLFREWFFSLRDKVHREPLGWLLSKALEQSEYEFKLLSLPHGAQQVANVRKLWAMAVEQPDISPQEFIRQLEMLSRVEQREGNAPTYEEEANIVRLFTVHSAKGLEFPVVFVADTGFRKRPRDSHLEADPEDHLLALSWKGYEPVGFKRLKQWHERREQAEAQRTLYVALTRARDYLIVCLTPTQNPWANTLAGALRQLVPKASGIYEVGNSRILWKKVDH
jgi:ATP-dependent helicase/nuclease subunit A